MYDKNNQSFKLKKRGDVFALEKEVASHNKQRPDYEQVIESSKFKSLMKEKKKFTIPLTIFFLVFYFMLPILTSYSTILNTPAIGDISWAWIYGFAQFVMTWVLCIVYVKKSAAFDNKAQQIIEEEIRG